MYIWRVDEVAGTLLGKVPIVEQMFHTVSAMCVSPDNRLLILGDTAGNVSVWDILFRYFR